IMQAIVTDRLHAKQGRTIARWTLGTDERRLVVYLKRHYRLPWRHGLLALLWPEGSWSPAMQEWEHLEWARAARLPVPGAVAGRRRVHGALGAAPELPRRRGIDRHAPPARGHPAGGSSAVSAAVPPLETRTCAADGRYDAEPA